MQIHTGEGDGVDVFAVVCHGHELLTESNGVFAFGDAIEYFKVLFRDALVR